MHSTGSTPCSATQDREVKLFFLSKQRPEFFHCALRVFMQVKIKSFLITTMQVWQLRNNNHPVGMLLLLNCSQFANCSCHTIILYSVWLRTSCGLNMIINQITVQSRNKQLQKHFSFHCYEQSEVKCLDQHWIKYTNLINKMPNNRCFIWLKKNHYSARGVVESDWAGTAERSALKKRDGCRLVSADTAQWNWIKVPKIECVK